MLVKLFASFRRKFDSLEEFVYTTNKYYISFNEIHSLSNPRNGRKRRRVMDKRKAEGCRLIRVRALLSGGVSFEGLEINLENGRDKRITSLVKSISFSGSPTSFLKTTRDLKLYWIGEEYKSAVEMQ